MRPRLFPLLLFFLVSVISLHSPAEDRKLRIPLPKKSKYTPVQALNRDGVAALKKHDVDKAKRLFYKAYLIDPNDPFTLNNLGYVAELEGDTERAQKYYELSQANTSDALVDRSTNKEMEGQTAAKVAGHTESGPLKINQMNSEALSLLRKDRAPEADLVLQEALKLDSRNAFTLNNMGFAREKEGELEDAVRYYSQSAATGSRDPVVLAMNRDWRGKPISEVAARNADKAREQLQKGEDTAARVARLNLRGVSAVNRNDRRAARDYFRQAYQLDHSNAFALNNMGYLAELDGDRETAQSYYEQAQNATRARSKVAVSTRPEVEGRVLSSVAQQSDDLVESRMQAEVAAKRRNATGPPPLRTRDNRIIVDKPAPATQNPQEQQQQPPQQRQRPQLQNRQDQQPDQPQQQPPQEQ